ncbi:DNA-binding/iron metalloprotein/AP endonuclease [Pullulanibacillus camelliae]|uniref:tRNA N6-adenosine threonylcarbamoyltransferase n=1 Tax=Pullulanibacillus camelliae TaxID=1707096 RepID=A0A8J2YNH8_9BACL|nr:tRNA (adenosine(37)-N6)-threonylcarbamoyltransferase complex transferase subunit TsaD [Pullulanibacillus camelliae]GGE55913.1 DNA-binding/iron metalloprotein/AP endonuclease [Pullulanibacillus camelliae]
MKTSEGTIILGIETSCDETAAAVVADGRRILSNIVASQIKSHKRFGGVVPEIASRHHVEQITMVCEAALEEANMDWQDIDGIAVTEGPGLVGALLVGISAAKALAFAHQIPLIPVHHIAGHIYANRFSAEFQFPLVALIVSGGHTELIQMPGHGQYELIGETRDDAAGEAFDKVARILGLPYPGGPEIDRLSAETEPTLSFPRAWLEEGSFDFSFSGLKSAVTNAVHNAEQRGAALEKADVAASFQQSVIDVLVTKTMRAVKEYKAKQLLVAGGVAANRGLRQAITQAAQNAGVELIIPPIHLCTDNAAMIAAAGTINFLAGERAAMDLNAHPGLELINV